MSFIRPAVRDAKALTAEAEKWEGIFGRAAGSAAAVAAEIAKGAFAAASGPVILGPTGAPARGSSSGAGSSGGGAGGGAGSGMARAGYTPLLSYERPSATTKPMEQWTDEDWNEYYALLGLSFRASFLRGSGISGHSSGGSGGGGAPAGTTHGRPPQGAGYSGPTIGGSLATVGGVVTGPGKALISAPATDARLDRIERGIGQLNATIASAFRNDNGAQLRRQGML